MVRVRELSMARWCSLHGLESENFEKFWVCCCCEKIEEVEKKEEGRERERKKRKEERKEKRTAPAGGDGPTRASGGSRERGWALQIL